MSTSKIERAVLHSRSKAMAKPAKKSPAAADGHAAIEDWIKHVKADMRPIVQRVDELIRRTIPALRYAIKWRHPFYGLPEQGWIIQMWASTSHVTVVFFGGADFDPPPPHKPGTIERIRYVRMKTLEEAQGPMMRKWIEQAGRVRGWVMVGGLRGARPGHVQREWISASTVGEKLSPRMRGADVNKLLESAGFLKRSDGGWVATEASAPHAIQRDLEEGKKPYVQWRKSIIEVAQGFIDSKKTYA